MTQDKLSPKYSGRFKVMHHQGKISYEEALRNADSVNDLRLSIKLKGNGGEETQNDPLSALNLMDDAALAESLNS